MAKVIVNIKEEAAIISKRNLNRFDKHDFLPANFSKTLKKLRGFTVEEMLTRLGITKQNLTFNKKR